MPNLKVAGLSPLSWAAHLEGDLLQTTVMSMASGSVHHWVAHLGLVKVLSSAVRTACSTIPWKAENLAIQLMEERFQQLMGSMTGTSMVGRISTGQMKPTTLEISKAEVKLDSTMKSAISKEQSMATMTD